MRAAWIACALLWATSALARPTPAERCEAGKYRVTNNYALCRARAAGKLLLGADPARYARLLSACADKLSTDFERFEESASKKGARCPTAGDALSIKQVVDVYLQDLSWLLALAPFRFSDNGDGTITDHHTALMWEKKIALVAGNFDYSNPHNAGNGYHWSGFCENVLNEFKRCQPSAAAAAACAAGVQGDATGCGQCNGGSDGPCVVEVDNPGETTIWQWVVDLNAAAFAGYNDWRIPTAAELFSIVDQQAYPTVSAYPFQGSSCGPTCTDLGNPACSCTNPTLYFTSTTSFLVPEDAWSVQFGSGGGLLTLPKVDDVWIRAVRGP